MRHRIALIAIAVAMAAVNWTVTSRSIPVQTSTSERPTISNLPVVTPIRAYEDYRIVPVRVHLLRDSENRAAVTSLTERDVSRIFAKANGIWHQAGVHLWVESVIAENPASTAAVEHATSLPTGSLRALRPAATRGGPMFHVYYIGEMEPNGIFMGRDAILRRPRGCGR